MVYNQIQKIDNPTPSATDKWGVRSVIDGYHMIVARDGDTITEIYKRDTNGVWQNIGNITGETGLAMYGNYFTVTRPASQVLAIFDKDILSSLQTFTEATGTGTFGNSASISENYIVIGDQAKNSNSGQIFIYEKTGTNSWTAYSNNPIILDASNAQDFFGSAVATNDESIIVGAMGDNQKTGAVYIFKKDANTGIWEQTQKLFASDGEINDQFGESISVSGDHFVVGASLKDSLDGDVNSGAAYVFKYSTDWYEIDKLVGIDESSYEGNHFGESVNINGDHIIVGSPGARLDKGVADVFYKKRSWGHLKKIVGDDIAAGDDFGTSVSVSGRFIAVGSPDHESATTGGVVYMYEDPSVRLRLAQEFDVNNKFIPTKASVYLKRVGQNKSNFWSLYNNIKTVIDATNFSTITGEESIIRFDDTISGFTGNGYMIATINDPSLVGDAKVINYPIRAINPDTYDLWIRVINIDTSSLEMDILMDGNISKTIDTTIDNPSDGLGWSWIRVTLVVPDGKDHILGIRIKESNIAIDKIYIDVNSITPYTEGPNLTISPYLTTHMRVYDIASDLIGYWKLDDTGATSVVKEVTGNYDGQLWGSGGSPSVSNVSNVTTNDAVINRAFALNGNYYVKIADSDDFSFTSGSYNPSAGSGDSPFSVAFWINFNDIDSTTSIISKLGLTGILEWGVLLINSNIILYLGDIEANASVVGSIDISSLFSLGEWIFCVLSYDGSGTVSGLNIYIGGVKQNINRLTGGNYLQMSNTTIPLIFGAFDGSLYYFDGSLDNIMIFNTELTQDKILLLYNDGNGIEDGFFNAKPNDSLMIYDYKNSINEIIQDDWYNFDISVLDTTSGYNEASDFYRHFLVMTTSGSNTSNFITWELVDNEVEVNPSEELAIYSSSAIKF